MLQDIGFFTVGDSEITLQDSLNSEAMEALNSYAQRAGRVAGRALAALNRHFSPGATRQAKDTDAIWLVRAGCRTCTYLPCFCDVMLPSVVPGV